MQAMQENQAVNFIHLLMFPNFSQDLAPLEKQKSIKFMTLPVVQVLCF